jgi:simple sugar transport system permease protein
MLPHDAAIDLTMSVVQAPSSMPCGIAAARDIGGVPVGKMKIGLFIAVGFMAWFTGMHTLFLFNTIQSGQGVGNEVDYIIAAVADGCLLTGRYGAAVGALIFGMVNRGIVYVGWNPNWFQFFVGTLLLGTILLNTYIRRRAEAAI